MTPRALADAQVRRTLVCLRACEPYDTASLEAGALGRLIAAGLAMTSAAELVFGCVEGNRKLSRQILVRLEGACRDFLDARVELIRDANSP